MGTDFSWGSDTYGQLGHQLGQSMQPVPKIVKTLATQHVVQIACGQRHTVALTNSEYKILYSVMLQFTDCVAILEVQG